MIEFRFTILLNFALPHFFCFSVFQFLYFLLHYLNILVLYFNLPFSFLAISLFSRKYNIQTNFSQPTVNISPLQEKCIKAKKC
jgi:hypothetical protein